MANTLTDVDISNLALRRVRAATIGALTENTRPAVEANALYAARRDQLLAMHAWGFANKVAALTLTGNTPTEWTYEYTYPNDCLRLHYIVPRSAGGNNLPAVEPGGYPWRVDYEAVPYQIGDHATAGTVIWTDVTDAYISYTRRVTETGRFDPLFADALGWFMAIDLAIPLGGDSGRRYRDEARDGFNQIMSQAAARDANQKQRGRQRLPRAIQARHNITDYDYPYWRQWT